MKQLKAVIISILFLSISAVSADHLKEHSIEKRIAPAGSVYVEGDDVPVAKPAEVADSGAKSPEAIYKASCATCHATDAIGAPMFGNAASWTDRIAKGEQTLIDNAINGINGMPPMGTCATCSKEDMVLTVKYMIENSQ